MVGAQLVWLLSKLSVNSHINWLSIALNVLISDSSLLAYHLSVFFPLFTKCLFRNRKIWIVCDQIKMPSANEHYAVSCNQTLTAEKKHYHLYDSMWFPKEALPFNTHQLVFQTVLFKWCWSRSKAAPNRHPLACYYIIIPWSAIVHLSHQLRSSPTLAPLTLEH